MASGVSPVRLGASSNSSSSSSSSSTKVSVSRQELWDALMTTMPNANKNTWCGKLGEWSAWYGPQRTQLRDYGAMLHLYKMVEDQKVEVVYHQAKTETPGAVTTGPHLRNGVFHWDKEQLDAVNPKYTFTPDMALLNPSLEQWQEEGPTGYRVLRVMPFAGHGFVFGVAVALPGEFGQAVVDASPPHTVCRLEGQFKLDDVGDYTAMIGFDYDLATGDLFDHRGTWQRATVPVSEPPADYSGAAVAAVTPPGDDHVSVTSVQQYYNQHQGKLQPATVTEYTYNHKLQLVKEVNHGCGFYLADVGPNPVEVWYPKGIYLRAPDSLPQAMSRMDLVQFELGAIRR
eukprot:jgi/Chrzof1/4696/Cz14g23060.t1